MLREAFEYPLAGDWGERVLVGGLLTLGGAIILLPAVPLQGYFVAVLRSVANDGSGEAGTWASGPPPFDDWEELSLDGLKAVLVAVPYAVVSTIAVTVAVFLLTAGFVARATGDGGAASLAVLAVAGLVTAVAAVAVTAATYLYPVALAHFAVEGSVEAAFDVRTVATIAWTREYALAWLFVSTAGVVLSALAGVLSLLAAFYLQVAFFYLFARGYATGREKSLAP
jgi:hypothetical protein